MFIILDVHLEFGLVLLSLQLPLYSDQTIYYPVDIYMYANVKFRFKLCSYTLLYYKSKPENYVHKYHCDLCTIESKKRKRKKHLQCLISFKGMQA